MGVIDLDSFHLLNEEIPDLLMEFRSRAYKASSYGSRQKVDIPEAKLKLWIEGLGEEALKNGDWKVAIIAYDIATGGNIMSRSDVIQTIREITKEDKSGAVEAAKTIQTRKMDI